MKRFFMVAPQANVTGSAGTVGGGSYGILRVSVHRKAASGKLSFKQRERSEHYSETERSFSRILTKQVQLNRFSDTLHILFCPILFHP